MAKINIKSGNRVISIESDDAGVPDVTEGTGPDLIELQDDAMAEPGEENAEFDAAGDDSAVEEEDKTEAVEKANESFFNAIFGLEDGEEAAITDDGDGTTSDTDEVVTTDEGETTETADEGEGAGEVSEGDGTTTIDTGDTVITITNTDDEGEEEVAEEETETPDEEAPAAEEETPAEGAEGANAETEGDVDQAIESFFSNFGL